MTKETAMKILKELHGKSLFAERTALETLIPELKESEDERIRKALVRFHKSTIDIDGIKGADILAWLEKQGESYTKKDVDDAYLKGISDAKNELEKQGEQKSVLDFKASNWYVSKVDGKIHDMTYNPADKVEQKQEWGDEDENYLQSAENACEYQYGKNTSTILWLKSLKDRIICKNTI